MLLKLNIIMQSASFPFLLKKKYICSFSLGVLWSALDTCVNHSRRAAAFTVCVVTLLIQTAVLKMGSVGRKVVNGGIPLFYFFFAFFEAN